MTKKQVKTYKNVSNASAIEYVNALNKGQYNAEPSLTVQGMTEPLETILERFQRGQTILGSKIYYDTDTIENLEFEQPFKESEFDLSDIDIAKANLEAYKEEEDAKKRTAKEAQKRIDDEKLADEILARREKEKTEKLQQTQQTQTSENQTI